MIDGWIDRYMELYYYIPYLYEHFIRAIGQLSPCMYYTHVPYLYLYTTNDTATYYLLGYFGGKT